MCEPMTAMMGIGLALSAAGMAMQYQQASAAADAQEAYQNAQAEQQHQYMMQNAKAATDAFIDKSAQENQRLSQTRESTAEQVQADQREADKKAGTALASAQSFGSTITNDIFREHTRYSSNMKQNLTWEENQVKMNIDGFRAEAQDRTNSVRAYIPSPVSRPSGLAAAASWGSQAAQTGMTYFYYDEMKNGTPKPTPPAKAG